MSLSINVRVLMFLFALVCIINIANLFLTFRKPTNKANRINPPFTDLLFSYNASKIYKNKTSSTIESEVPHNKETCPATYSEEFDSYCPVIPPALGPMNVSLSEDLQNIPTVVGPSGLTQCSKCLAQQQIAVILPYSGRLRQLHVLLYQIHTLMQKQLVDYQIFVVEFGNKSTPMYRGQLFNIGFLEAQKLSKWHCIIFHELHLLPKDSRNLYRCGWYPRQLAVNVDLGTSRQVSVVDSPTDRAGQLNDSQVNSSHLSPHIPGGALSVMPQLFISLNGFSNTLLRQSEVYENFYQRITSNMMTLEKIDFNIGTYESFEPEPYDITVTNSNSTKKAYLLDGLNTISYDLESVLFGNYYTHVTVGSVSLENNKEKL